jgi:hypothetical protein
MLLLAKKMTYVVTVPQIIAPLIEFFSLKKMAQFSTI